MIMEERILALIAMVIIFVAGFLVHSLFQYAADNTTSKGRKRRIYVVHPYRGSEDNKALIREICRALTAQGFLPISPVHNFDFLNEENPEEREIAINLSLELLSTADEVYVFGDWLNSKGCIREIAAANKKEIPVRYFSEGVL